MCYGLWLIIGCDWRNKNMNPVFPARNKLFKNDRFEKMIIFENGWDDINFNIKRKFKNLSSKLSVSENDHFQNRINFWKWSFLKNEHISGMIIFWKWSFSENDHSRNMFVFEKWSFSEIDPVLKMIIFWNWQFWRQILKFSLNIKVYVVSSVFENDHFLKTIIFEKLISRGKDRIHVLVSSITTNDQP